MPLKHYDKLHNFNFKKLKLLVIYEQKVELILFRLWLTA